jgi:hypothetical protein
MGWLIDAIGAGNMDPSAPGPVVVRLHIWTGQFITASYYKYAEGEMGDLESSDDIIHDDEAIRPFAERLVHDGTSFTTITGSDDMVCSLRWELEK